MVSLHRDDDGHLTEAGQVPNGPSGSRLSTTEIRRAARRLVDVGAKWEAAGLAKLAGEWPTRRSGDPASPPSSPSSSSWRPATLCELRDVREQVGSLDFTPEQVRELYAQHTAETGQEFTGEAVERAVESTAGQPWLVNPLARLTHLNRPDQGNIEDHTSRRAPGA
jgi:hypothetical protein